MERDQSENIVAVVLAAGEGRRLGPLRRLRPKPLCSVGTRTLIDLALDRVTAVVDDVAVNLHHDADLIEAHLGSRSAAVHRVRESPRALGTAGAIANLRTWIDGRDVLVVNADAWTSATLDELVRTRSADRVTVLGHGADRFGSRVGVVASILPWEFVRRLPHAVGGLYEVVWRDAHERGALDYRESAEPFVDCGTPADLLRANMRCVARAGGSIVDPTAVIAEGAVVVGSVIEAGAIVEGEVRESLVWPGGHIGRHERLVRTLRASDSLSLGPFDPGPIFGPIYGR